MTELPANHPADAVRADQQVRLKFAAVGSRDPHPVRGDARERTPAVVEKAATSIRNRNALQFPVRCPPEIVRRRTSPTRFRPIGRPPPTSDVPPTAAASDALLLPSATRPFADPYRANRSLPRALGRPSSTPHQR